MYPVITIGSVSVPSFGVMLAVGCGISLLLLRRISRYTQYRFATLHTLTVLMLAGGAIGARLVYMLTVQHTADPAQAGNIGQGTMCYGFLLGGVAAVAVYVNVAKPGWGVADVCMPAWSAVHICGRVGCFLAGCCYGKGTDLPWGVCYHHPQSIAPQGVFLHPTQLYEAAAMVVIGRLLFGMLKRRHAPGAVVLAYFMLYAVVRFGLEYLRADFRGDAFGGALSTSQVFSLAAFAAGLALWLVKRWQLKRAQVGIQAT